MGAGEGVRRGRRAEGDDNDDEDEEYVLEEDEEEENEDYEYAPEELSASSGGEGGEGSDAAYEEEDAAEDDDEGDTPWPARRRNPTPGRSRQRRYEEDDDYLEEPEEDEEEVDDCNEDLDEEADAYHEDLEEEEEEVAPTSVTKCEKRKVPQAEKGSNNGRKHKDEDMDFDPDLDEGEGEEDDMDFDPEVEDDQDFEDDEDEEGEETGVSHTRKARVKNTVRRKPVSKQQHRRKKKKNSNSKVSARVRKGTPVRRRRKRSVMDHYDDDDDFIVDDQNEVDWRSRKKAKVGRQIEVDHLIPIVDETAWPTVESDTSDFDFVTSEEEVEDVELPVIEPVTVRKGRKKRIYRVESSSDSEFHVSDKELGDFRATELPETQLMLAGSPNRISVTRNGEDKGKEKKEPEESGRPTCGICLSEEQRITTQGVLNCCSHFFCFACIMEWSRVESRCPLCKRRFTTITKSPKIDLGSELIKSVIRVEERDQVYQPTEDEIRRWLDPYENVVCIECNQGGDDSLMLLCDICDSSAHTYCVGLGREVPEGSWYCGGCRVSGEGPSYHRSPVNSNSEDFSIFEGLPSISPQQSFQGIDLNVSPRDIFGENHLAESQASTAGIPIPSGRPAGNSGRRQLNELISILRSRPQQVISPEMGHSGLQHNGHVPRTELNHRSLHALPGANTSQHSGSVPRIEPNHRNFEAASEGNSSQTLAGRRRMNEWISMLLSRRRTTISAELDHSAAQNIGSVRRTEPYHRNFSASLEANTSQLSSPVPRTEPNHRSFEATSDANTLQALPTRDADLSRRFQRNECLDILQSRPRLMNSPGMGNYGVQTSVYVPETAPNHWNFHALSEANTSQTLLGDVRNQHSGFPLVHAPSNFTPCISVDGNNLQQTEGVKSNMKRMCSISPR